MKRILFLGAAKFQTPAIEYAKGAGYYTITLDNRPDNPGHKLSHKSYSNISTLAKSEVLAVAKQESIDGILSFGSDISALTVAYVAQELRLNGNTPESILTLTNKSLFRQFLDQGGILKDYFYKEVNTENLKAIKKHLKIEGHKYIIKPVDSSGSKGASLLCDLDRFQEQTLDAISYSTSKTAVIESYIKRKGFQICGDGYFTQEKIQFIHYGDGHFYEGGFAPYAETFPSTHSSVTLKKVSLLLERILNLSGFKQGTFNFDVIIDENDSPFVIEIGPRSGGNYIPSAIKEATGIDLIKAAVESSLDSEFQLESVTKSNKLIACYMIHSSASLTFKGYKLNKKLQEKLIMENTYLDKEQQLSSFKQASDVAGNLVFLFNEHQDMLDTIENMNTHITFL